MRMSIRRVPIFICHASAYFGQRGTVVLTNLIARYAVLAYNMNAFEVKAPPATAEPALPV